MRNVLASVPMDGTVIIGEGEKDEAPMLYNGERIGDGSPPAADIAGDPIDGTTLTALGRGNASAVIAVSDAGTLFDPGPCVYMEKLAVGPEAADAIDITKSPTENLHQIAEALNRPPRDLTAVVLDRDRHRDLITELREVGCRIRLIPDGDVAGAISTAEPESGADVLFGIGGTPEGVIAAVALKCMDGNLQGKLWPRNDREREAALAAGLPDRVPSVTVTAAGASATGSIPAASRMASTIWALRARDPGLAPMAAAIACSSSRPLDSRTERSSASGSMLMWHLCEDR